MLPCASAVAAKSALERNVEVRMMIRQTNVKMSGYNANKNRQEKSNHEKNE